MRTEMIKRRPASTPRAQIPSAHQPASKEDSTVDGYSSGKPAEKLNSVYLTWTTMGFVLVVILAIFAISKVSDLTASGINHTMNSKGKIPRVISKPSGDSIPKAPVIKPKPLTEQIHPLSNGKKIISNSVHHQSIKQSNNLTESMGATYYWYPMDRDTVSGLVEADPIQAIQGDSFKKKDLRKGDDGINGINDLDDLTHSVRLSLCYMYRPMHKIRVKHMIGHRDLTENLQWKQGVSDDFFLRSRIDVEINQFNNVDFDRRPAAKSSRMYESNPIKMGGEWRMQPESELECDIPCIKCQSGTCDVDRIRWTMENVVVKEEGSHKSKVITATTWLNSQVPVPYFSYYEFGILTPYIYPKDKSIGPALSAAFISNCGYAKRNHLVVDFRMYDEKEKKIWIADSYGRCEHNKDENRIKSRDHTKLSTLANHYYFSLAFENSETIDYISEKFFGSLTSGTVPVYLGAPNCKFYAPDVGDYDRVDLNNVDSIIYTGDYQFDAKKLADLMKELYYNQTRYLEKLRWKRIGFSGDYQALNELTSTHTACRQCILAADRNRINGKVHSPDFDSPIFTYVFGQSESGNTRIFYIRERGTYRFYKLVFYVSKSGESDKPESPLTFERFVTGILRVMYRRRVEFNLWKNNQHPNYHRIGPSIYAIYRIPHKTPILNVNHLDLTPNFSELEIIFT